MTPVFYLVISLAAVGVLTIPDNDSFDVNGVHPSMAPRINPPKLPEPSSSWKSSGSNEFSRRGGTAALPKSQDWPMTLKLSLGVPVPAEKRRNRPQKPTQVASAQDDRPTRAASFGNMAGRPESTPEAFSSDISTNLSDDGGTDSGYMAVVNQWRSKLALSSLLHDAKLEANAQDASDSSGGQLIHKKNPGTFAQVMGQGDASKFDSVFVGGWLCELPDLPGLDGVCATMSKGWDHAGQVGHAQILTSTEYTKIGCGFGQGIWTCDLA